MNMLLICFYTALQSPSPVLSEIVTVLIAEHAESQSLVGWSEL